MAQKDVLLSLNGVAVKLTLRLFDLKCHNVIITDRTCELFCIKPKDFFFYMGHSEVVCTDLFSFCRSPSEEANTSKCLG